MNAVVEHRSKIAALRLAPRAPALALPATYAPELVVNDPGSARAESLRELGSQLILRWFGECRTLHRRTSRSRCDRRRAIDDRSVGRDLS